MVEQTEIEKNQNSPIYEGELYHRYLLVFYGALKDLNEYRIFKGYSKLPRGDFFTAIQLNLIDQKDSVPL